jgi:hypothetical protein
MSKISATLINYIINIIFKLMGGKESTGLKVKYRLRITPNRSKRGARHRATFARAASLRSKMSTQRSKGRHLRFPRVRCNKYSESNSTGREVSLSSVAPQTMCIRLEEIPSIITNLLSMSSSVNRSEDTVISPGIKVGAHTHLMIG